MIFRREFRFDTDFGMCFFVCDPRGDFIRERPMGPVLLRTKSLTPRNHLPAVPQGCRMRVLGPVVEDGRS